jgi:protein-S-isoprenylcysteine O-methyltransferase Ste14
MNNTAVSKSSPILVWARGIFTVGFILMILFVPAGTLAWPEAWIFLIGLTGFSFGVYFWLKKRNPGLLKERTSREKAGKPWDRALLFVYYILLIALLVIPGLDAVRFGWSRVPVLLRILGFLGLIPPALLCFSTVKHNAFLSDVVRIQEDRGHRVCSTGPYRFVRHPMYDGVILAVLMTPMALGSFFAMIPAVLIGVLFILRTALEDKTLRAELPGYLEYSCRVRYRLVPGIW